MGVMAMSKGQEEQATPERWSAKAKTEVILSQGTWLDAPLTSTT